MTELQWGIPIQGGETAPDGLPVWLYKVSADGTRRIEPHPGQPPVTRGPRALVVLRKRRTVPVEYAGYIPT